MMTGRSVMAAAGALLALVMCAPQASAQRADVENICARGGDAATVDACRQIDTGRKVAIWGGIAGAVATGVAAIVATRTGGNVANAAVTIGGAATGAVTLIGVGMEGAGYRNLVREQSQGASVVGARAVGRCGLPLDVVARLKREGCEPGASKRLSATRPGASASLRTSPEGAASRTCRAAGTATR